MYDRLKHWRDVSALLGSGAANVYPMLVGEPAENTQPAGVEVLLPGESLRTFVPPSAIIEVKDSAGKLLRSYCLIGGSLVIVGSPAPKPPA
jgi:hypothetical protein